MKKPTTIKIVRKIRDKNRPANIRLRKNKMYISKRIAFNITEEEACKLIDDYVVSKCMDYLRKIRTHYEPYMTS